MNENLLHDFFAGDVLPKDRNAIKRWLDESDEHSEALIGERALFDALLLAGDEKAGACNPVAGRRRSLRPRLRELLGTAAAVAVICLAGAYIHDRRMDGLRAATHTLTVPAGQRANLQLPDGTNVWLNARSRITYPGCFTGSTREVTLDGEAWFEVEHDRKKTFIVHTDKYNIHVKGTKFNVNAYAGMGDFSTALMEGAVDIQYRDEPDRFVRLSPNRQAREQNGLLTVVPVDDFDAYRWREGLICFKKTDFLTLMMLFEKCYGIRVVVRNRNIAEKVFSGKFRMADGIDNALRVLQKESLFTFERNDDQTSICIK
ncbi:MAG: FecR domain-containing protein [Tannerella sp.]|jgi:ferric-dicitrate binding protein FerR (iron transport regulator)|nr:FecR domain-containing protein [Tannerella sp.]